MDERHIGDALEIVGGHSVAQEDTSERAQKLENWVLKLDGITNHKFDNAPKDDVFQGNAARRSIVQRLIKATRDIIST